MAKTVNTSILKVYDELGNEIPIPAIKGESAYELYKKNGGTLTEAQWLESLKGEKGDNYILTNTDKQEIAQIALANLPTWEGGSY